MLDKIIKELTHKSNQMIIKAKVKNNDLTLTFIFNFI